MRLFICIIKISKLAFFFYDYYLKKKFRILVNQFQFTAKFKTASTNIKASYCKHIEYFSKFNKLTNIKHMSD